MKIGSSIPSASEPLCRQLPLSQGNHHSSEQNSRFRVLRCLLCWESSARDLNKQSQAKFCRAHFEDHRPILWTKKSARIFFLFQVVDHTGTRRLLAEQRWTTVGHSPLRGDSAFSTDHGGWGTNVWSRHRLRFGWRCCKSQQPGAESKLAYTRHWGSSLWRHRCSNAQPPPKQRVGSWTRRNSWPSWNQWFWLVEKHDRKCTSPSSWERRQCPLATCGRRIRRYESVTNRVRREI